MAFEEGDALEELGAFREEGFFLLGGVRDVEAFAHVHEEVVLQDPRHAPQDAHMDRGLPKVPTERGVVHLKLPPQVGLGHGVVIKVCIEVLTDVRAVVIATGQEFFGISCHKG